jgi:hypothetical protein
MKVAVWRVGAGRNAPFMAKSPGALLKFQSFSAFGNTSAGWCEVALMD